jgi:transglutaminase-like putative cysteine protease
MNMNTASQRYPIVFLGWLATVAMSLSFLPALTDRRFFVLGALFAALVVGTGLLLRLIRTPVLLVLAAQLLVLVEGLALGFGHSLKFGVLPTDETVTGIGDLVRSGIDISQRYAAPAPSNGGLLLMVVFAIGLVAAAVDALAVGVGRVPLAGLPLLALYTVPVAALPKGISFLAFLPGAACYIALLTADERDRLVHWGRLVTRAPTDPQREVDLSGLRDSGRRIGLAALSLAVVVPVFVPSLSGSILDSHRDGGIGGDGPGGPTLGFADPMVSLARSLQTPDVVDLLDVDSRDVDPQYLRLTVLDEPGANGWTERPVSLDDTVDLGSVLPGPPGLGLGVSSIPHDMIISLTSNFPPDSAWVPIPFDTHFVDAGSNLGFVPADQTVAVRDNIALQSMPPYQVSYSELNPTVQQLQSSGTAPAQVRQRYGQVPAGVPAIVSNIAHSVTDGAQTPYDKALLLQGFFRDRGAFTYDTRAAYGSGYAAMGTFLEQRRGFCQHFAATMAMMARTLNIPSRVVVGFLESSRSEASGRYVFTSHDVHSWPELYFEGVGWVRFEPTPRGNAPFPRYAPRVHAPDPPTSAPSSETQANPLDKRTLLDRGAGAAGASNGSNGGGSGGSLPSAPWLVLLAVGLLACVPGLSRWALRRTRIRRPLDPAAAAEAAWTELRDSMLDLRLPWTGSMTPRARERSVGQYLGGDHEALDALHRLSRSVERARFADRPLDDASPASDVSEVVAVMSREAGRGARVRAMLLPASLRPDVRVWWDQMRSRLRRSPAERAGGTAQ